MDLGLFIRFYAAIISNRLFCLWDGRFLPTWIKVYHLGMLLKKLFSITKTMHWFFLFIYNYSFNVYPVLLISLVNLGLSSPSSKTELNTIRNYIIPPFLQIIFNFYIVHVNNVFIPLKKRVDINLTWLKIKIGYWTYNAPYLHCISPPSWNSK